VKAIHDQDTAHLDIGSHSVWVEPPTLVRLSHLLAARIDDVESLGERRYAFLSSGKIPDEADSSAADPKSKDCFLAGIVAHQIVFDLAPSAPTPGAPPKWDRSVDADDSFQTIHAWFEKALSWTGSARFADAGAMLDAFNAAANVALPSGQTLARLEAVPGLEDAAADLDGVAVRPGHFGERLLRKLGELLRRRSGLRQDVEEFGLGRSPERTVPHPRFRRTSGLPEDLAPARVCFYPEGRLDAGCDRRAPGMDR